MHPHHHLHHRHHCDHRHHCREYDFELTITLILLCIIISFTIIILLLILYFISLCIFIIIFILIIIDFELTFRWTEASDLNTSSIEDSVAMRGWGSFDPQNLWIVYKNILEIFRFLVFLEHFCRQLKKWKKCCQNYDTFALLSKKTAPQNKPAKNLLGRCVSVVDNDVVVGTFLMGLVRWYTST